MSEDTCEICQDENVYSIQFIGKTRVHLCKACNHKLEIERLRLDKLAKQRVNRLMREWVREQKVVKRFDRLQEKLPFQEG